MTRPSPAAAKRLAGAGAALAAALLPARLPAVEPEPAPPVGEAEELTVIAPSRLARPPAQAEGLSVRVVEREEIEASGARTLQEALRALPGVHLADEQGNAFQQDLSLRGFTVSSVTGLAQGISVFLDGVRVNEPAAEEVNFDLLPLTEVERIEIVHGPAGIFGRNTFGGAVHVVTRRGGERTEAEVEADGGSWWRREAHARVGGRRGAFDGYLAAGGFAEDGWRVQGGGKGARAFGKLGYRRDGTDVALSYQAQVDRLQQAGSLPEADLARDRRQNYTPGDFFRPALHLATLNARQALGPDLGLAAVAFFRALDAEQFNSSWSAADTRLWNRTRSLGTALQLDWQASLGPIRSRLSGGAEATGSDVRIRTDEESNAREPGAGRVADLLDRQWAAGAFAQESLRLGRGPLSGLGATASLRWDLIDHRATDRTPTTDLLGAARKNFGHGSATYSAWIPALGLAWSSSSQWLLSASWTRGYRAPAFLEITCGSVDSECVGLQKGVASDATFTRLRPVRSSAFEASLSSAPWHGLSVAATAFWIDLRDDIYSVASTGGPNRVYFQNVGPTRRAGLEATARLRSRLVDADLGYAYTRATFESDVVLASARTPPPQDQQVVRRGAELPLTPRHRADLGLRLKPQGWWSLEAGVLWVGSQVVSGDEANETPRLPSYAVARAGAEARWRGWSAFLRVQNPFDVRYATFGTWAPDGRGSGEPARFLTPGVPTRVVAGIRWELE